MHRVLIYFGSIINVIIMIIFVLVLVMNYLDWIFIKEKSTSTFGMYFSCFGPFWVWGVTSLTPKSNRRSEDFVQEGQGPWRTTTKIRPYFLFLIKGYNIPCSSISPFLYRYNSISNLWCPLYDDYSLYNDYSL